MRCRNRGVNKLSTSLPYGRLVLVLYVLKC
nr:MAG TPA: hypothetical protein [Caudoviricetes sp.]